MSETILDFWQHAARFPDRTTLIGSDGTTWSAGRLLSESNRVANGLRALGANSGDVVAILMPSCPEFIVVSLATAQTGMYLLTLNPRLSSKDQSYMLRDSGARLLIVHWRAASPTQLEAVVRASPALAISVGSVEGCIPYESTFGACPDSAPSDRRAGFLLTYTSGTTGRPKAVLRTPVSAPAEQVLRGLITWFMNRFDVRSGGTAVHLCACPLHFGGPLLFASYALHLGHTVVLMPGWHPTLALQLIEKHKVTTTFVVPYQLSSLLKLPVLIRDRYSHASLECVIHSSAPCPQSVKRAMLEWWGDTLFECYASTEVAGTVASPAEWRRYPGTVGRMMPPEDLRICDEGGIELPPNKPGLIYMRSNVGNAFVYKGDPDKTREGRRGDFVTVRDVGYVNEDGYLFLLDRRTDMISCRGEHVYPAEIEGAVAGHALVDDCAAFGVPHPEWGEEIRLAVKLTSGSLRGSAVTAELLAALRAEVGAAKCPSTLDFVDSIPRDESGKLRRHELRARFSSKSELPTAGRRCREFPAK